MARIKIYCDESRQNNSPFKLIGGVWVPEQYGWAFVDEFLTDCESMVGCHPAHMKWGNVPSKSTSRYMCFYTKLIDKFFEYSKLGMFYRVVIADQNYIMDHHLYNCGDYEQGFWKLYYQLLFHPLVQSNEYHVRIAHREVSQKIETKGLETRLSDLQEILNNGFRKKLANRALLNQNVVGSVEARMAKDRILIQCADIITGAIGYHWHNEHLKNQPNEGRVFLAKYIAGKLGRNNLRFTTLPATRPVNIFRLRPR